MKVGDLVRSYGSVRRDGKEMGIVVRAFTDFYIDDDGYGSEAFVAGWHVLWENGNIDWVYDDDVEVISEGR